MQSNVFQFWWPDQEGVRRRHDLQETSWWGRILASQTWLCFWLAQACHAKHGSYRRDQLCKEGSSASSEYFKNVCEHLDSLKANDIPIQRSTRNYLICSKGIVHSKKNKFKLSHCPRTLMPVESQVKWCSPRNILGASRQNRGAATEVVSSCFFWTFSYILKQVPIYFSCFGERCNSVLLWSSRKHFVDSETSHSFRSGQWQVDSDWNFIFRWTFPLKIDGIINTKGVVHTVVTN